MARIASESSKSQRNGWSTEAWPRNTKCQVSKHITEPHCLLHLDRVAETETRGSRCRVLKKSRKKYPAGNAVGLTSQAAVSVGAGRKHSLQPMQKCLHGHRVLFLAGNEVPIWGRFGILGMMFLKDSTQRLQLT